VNWASSRIAGGPFAAASRALTGSAKLSLMPKHPSHILELARRGAEERYRELIAELKMLTRSFPHLRDSFDPDELPVNFILRRGRDKARVSAPKARKRSWSPAARQAAAARMKAYWAKRKGKR
jgi:hypothetical protein